ncbi:MAG: glycosyltransferase family 2 protein [Bacteroidota bacterium]|nr:glycosyltransferase family 2 protein [Bacteroidota bacterium]
MNDITEISLLFITIALILLFIINLINLFSLPKINSIQKNISNKNKDVLVSVLIPARNEEDNIARCIKSVLNQSYGNIEIIVLNDNSSDRTGEIFNSIEDSRLKIINGKPLEAGWVGKNFACDQLQRLAKGKYLLFIDADTEMSKGCVSAAVFFAAENGTDLLSIMPYEESVTFWEKLVIPMLYFAVMVFLPVPMIEKSNLKQLAMGNGQFMFFKQSFYDKIGGHKSLKNKIVEDVWLARRIKEFGGKLIFADGTDIMKCRMYKGFEEIWSGFSKNVFAGLSFSSIGLITVILLYLVFFISPVFFLIFGSVISNSLIIYLSLISIIIPILIRITHSIKFRQPFLFSFINIFSSLFIIFVSLNSYRVLKFGKGARWKGREYIEEEIN